MSFVSCCRSERSDFKREPCKVSSLDGWTVELTDNSSQTNTFQLMNSGVQTVYKFRCSSHELTIAWLKALQKITRPYVEKLPTNLMTFEWNYSWPKIKIKLSVFVSKWFKRVSWWDSHQLSQKTTSQRYLLLTIYKCNLCSAEVSRQMI